MAKSARKRLLKWTEILLFSMCESVVSTLCSVANLNFPTAPFFSIQFRHRCVSSFPPTPLLWCGIQESSLTRETDSDPSFLLAAAMAFPFTPARSLSRWFLPVPLAKAAGGASCSPGTGKDNVGGAAGCC